MPNTIRIKRSTTTNTPTSLAQGELAFSEDDSPNGLHQLFIGTASSTITTIMTDDATTRGGTAAAPNDSNQDNQTITTGLGLDGADAGSSANLTIDFAPVELTNVAPVAADQFVFNDATDDAPKKQVASSIPLSIFNNDAGWTSTADAIHANFDFSTTTTAADPGSGNLRFNNATPASVTAIYVDDLQNDTTNAGWLLDNIAVNDIITIRAVDDPLDYLIVQVDSVTDNTGWFNFGVTVLGSGTLPANAAALQFDVDWASQAANQTITTGLGLDGADGGSSGNITIDFAPVELTNVTPQAADEIVISDNSDSSNPKTSTVSSFPINLFGDATGQVNMADNDLNRAVLEDFGVKHQSLTINTGGSPDTATVDCTLGNSAYIDLENATESVTLSFTNPPASGTYGEINLIVQQGSVARTINWPAAVDWKGGAPTLSTTNNVVDLFHFFTVDAGTTWYGTYALEAAGAGEANQTITTGLGLDGADAGTTGNVTIDLALTELSVVTAAAADWISIEDATDNSTKKALISAIDVGHFDNATTEYVSENDTPPAGFTGWNWVIDEDTMTSDSNIHVPTQQSVKAYVDTTVSSSMNYQGGYDANTNTPTLDTGSPSITIGDTYTVTAAGNFFTEAVEVGDVLIAEVTSSDAAQLSDWTIVQNNIGAASETEAGYIEIATQAEVDAASSTVLAVVPNYLHNTTFDGGSF